MNEGALLMTLKPFNEKVGLTLYVLVGIRSEVIGLIKGTKHI